MDEEVRERLEHAAEVHALRNALEHDGEANVGAVMGPLMAETPAFREHPDEVQAVVAEAVQEVNGQDNRRERLAALDPESLEALETPDEPTEDHDLPALPNVEEVDAVRLRCAPNPNGPWHVGHARMPAVIGSYRDRYDGWFCVRFDDTDPETKRPVLEAYDWIIEDCRYLGHEPDEVFRASDRLELYYDHARELIEAGGAYTCDLPGEEFSALKNAGEPSPNRSKDPETVATEFEAMVAGEYGAGDVTLRVKTDIGHKNPAVRDWTAFRMVDTPHPRAAAADYRCWPLLDFQSAIDDHDLEISHIVRGIDLQDSAKRQRYLYDYFDWTYPEVVHWGRVQVEGYDVSLSTSSIGKRVERGDLEGWDDPRAPTLRSLRRRGIRGEAITAAMVQLGTSTSDVDLPMSTIYAENRRLVDEDSDRRFLVRDGVQVALGGSPPAVAEPAVHPEDETRGVREIPVGDAVWLEAADVPDREERCWLKGLGCVRYTRDTLQYTGEDIDVVREEGVPVVHWAPVEGAVPVTLRTMDGDVAGHGEPGLATVAEDTVIQFERVGFARIDTQGEDGVVAFFAHP